MIVKGRPPRVQGVSPAAVVFGPAPLSKILRIRDERRLKAIIFDSTKKMIIAEKSIGRKMTKLAQICKNMTQSAKTKILNN